MMSPRRRWLVATTEYAGLTPYTGGIGTHYAALLPALVRQGVDVDLVVFSDGPAVAGADLGGVRLIAYERTDRMPRAIALVRRALRVRRASRQGGYDRVFLPEWIGLGAMLPADAPLLTNLATGMRLAHEVSGLRLRDLPLADRPVVLLQRAMEARQIRRSAGLIAISRAMLERTTSMFARVPRAAVVRNCIDLGRVRTGAGVAPPEGWPRGEDPIVLFLGRSERRKGVVEAVAAFGALHDRMPHVRLVLAGAGGDARFEPTRADLLALLPASARPLVTWLGHVPGDRLYGAVRAASVAMCPSRWEGFGNVALEAKTIGTPLVVTTGSGFDDFCHDGVDCLMVPPGTSGRLADALERLLTDRTAAATFARTAKEQVEAFAPDPVAIDLISAADALLG